MPKSHVKVNRHGGLDLLRIFSCFMVILVHTNEIYLFAWVDEPGLIILKDFAFSAAYWGAILRPCVPLFVMLSGYFLLPVKESPSVFFRRRFTRILFPFLIWSVLSAVIVFAAGEVYKDWKELLIGIVSIPFNFNPESGHLWFIYMLIGLYLITPVLSPWIQSAGEKAERWFLTGWAFTLFFPYLRLIFPELMGEASWNPISSFYYFGGFIGYFVLGHYVREHWKARPSVNRISGILMIAAAYAFTAPMTKMAIESSTDAYSAELYWQFLSINVALMTLGFFLLFKDIQIRNAGLSRLVSSFSALTFGIYLTHMLFIFAAPVIGSLFNLKEFIHYPPVLIVPGLAVIVFFLAAGFVRLIRLIPGGKYIAG